MPLDSNLLRHVLRLAVDARRLAAIGAWLRLRRTGADADLRVRARLEQYLDVAVPGGAASLGVDQDALLDFVQLIIEECADLLDHPERAPGASAENESRLLAQAALSAQTFATMLALAADRPALSAAFDGRFLDTGSGAGGYLLAAAAARPSLSAVGIDIDPFAARLARQRVAESPFSTRIEVQELDVRDLQPGTGFTVAWLPTTYLNRAATRAALRRLAEALRPGGWVIAGSLTPSEDPEAAAWSALRLEIDGGEPWLLSELQDELTLCGFVGVESAEPVPGVGFVLGSRPA